MAATTLATQPAARSRTVNRVPNPFLLTLLPKELCKNWKLFC